MSKIYLWRQGKAKAKKDGKGAVAHELKCECDVHNAIACVQSMLPTHRQEKSATQVCMLALTLITCCWAPPADYKYGEGSKHGLALKSDR